VFDKQVKQRPPGVAGVPVELSRLVAELLEKDPANRPADANELYLRIAPFAGDLPMLPGFLHPAGEPSPGRMYARIVGQVLAGSRG
jgi:non-specific serine/threonine protein kinase